MSASTKKVITLLIVAFLVFYLVTQPDAAGDAVQSLFGLLQQAAEAVVTFFRSLGDGD